MQRGCVRPKPAKRAMPDELTGTSQTARSRIACQTRTWLRPIQSETAVAEFPYFFGGVAAQLLNLPHLSIRDIFWVEGPRESFHPYFRDAVALIVDRRKKRITTYRACPLWAQPSYILLGHEGTYRLRFVRLGRQNTRYASLLERLHEARTFSAPRGHGSHRTSRRHSSEIFERRTPRGLACLTQRCPRDTNPNVTSRSTPRG